MLQLLDRHNRDCAEIAARLGVPHLKVPDSVPGSPFEAIAGGADAALAGDRALVARSSKALVVAEVLGRQPDAHRAGGERVGMHLFLRALAAGLAARATGREHLLLGHGSRVHGVRRLPPTWRAPTRAPARDLPRGASGGLPGARLRG